MEYISAEEFSKQDKKVQKIFLDWWKPSVGDICAYKMGRNIEDYYLWKKTFISCESDIKGIMHDIPLLTEGQLRKFIEDKTECCVSCFCEDYEKTYGYKIIHGFGDYDYKKDTDLLKAYWQVAVQIAEQEGKQND